MKDICRLCRNYTAMLSDCAAASNNDTEKALRSALTVSYMMLAETPDSETAELLERYSVACKEWEANFCIYRKGEIEEFVGRLEKAREEIQEVQDKADICAHLQKVLYELQERFKK